MKKLNIVQSRLAPTDGSSLWLKDSELQFCGANGWEPVRSSIPKATAEISGIVKQAKGVCQLDSTATKADIINTLNSLIVKLQAAGIME